MVNRSTLGCSLQVAPATTEALQLDRTIPDLLDVGCSYGNRSALHQWSPQGWQSYSYGEFRLAVEELALGLKAQGLTREPQMQEGLHIGLLLESNFHWALVDMGSLLAGLVTVPMGRHQPRSLLGELAVSAELQALVVSTWTTLQGLAGYLPPMALIVVIEESPPPLWVASWPHGTVIKTLTEVCQQGRQLYTLELIQALRSALHPDDLATIVYTTDAGGHGQGAMLSHRNVAGNIWAAFSSMPGLQPGRPEVALSFLPLNHIFARSFLYGHMGFGHHIYFSSSARVLRHLGEVKPTIFITVPRLLEKIYERVNGLRQQSRGLKRLGVNWGWQLAHDDRLSALGTFRSRLLGWWLGHGIFRDVRRVFGGQVRYLLCGGAALKPEIMTFFNHVGVPVQQGYGLTETSSVLSYTRDRWVRPGSVGVPIPGVTMRLGPDGEVLAKSPYLMAGYFHATAATAAVIDGDGWFHTGDWGEFSADGLLTLHGCKKGLFKLSTGKYVAPVPIEAQLEASPLVKQALLVGPGQKFCGVLIVPELSGLQAVMGLEDDSVVVDLEDVAVRSHYQTLIDRVNAQLPPWSTVKRFVLIQAEAEAGGSRREWYEAYGSAIAVLYQRAEAPVKDENSSWRRGWRDLEAVFRWVRRGQIA